MRKLYQRIKEDKKEDKKDLKIEQKKDEPSLAELALEIKHLKSQNAALDKAAKRAFYGERKDKKEEKKEEPALTDAEIKAIMKEHKDDPEVIFNAITYKMQNMVKGGVKQAAESVETKQRAERMNQMLRERVGEALDDETSEIHQMIVKAKDVLNLNGNPYGDVLAYAANVADALPAITKHWYERGLADANKKSADDVRKDDINKKKSPGSGNGSGSKPSSKQTELSDSQKETAERLGFLNSPNKMKIFRDQILRKAS